jgi:hypothetical protein
METEMKSAKETLLKTIEVLSEEEARRVLEITQKVRRGKREALTFKRLAHDPTFSLPPQGILGFRVVTPVQGKGSPASRLLEHDRR